MIYCQHKLYSHFMRPLPHEARIWILLSDTTFSYLLCRLDMAAQFMKVHVMRLENTGSNPDEGILPFPWNLIPAYGNVRA